MSPGNDSTEVRTTADLNGATMEPPTLKFAPATNDSQHLAHLKEKFGKKFQDIVDRYGAVETVYDDNGEIVDVAPPEEYLEEIDQQILHALATGGEIDDKWVPTVGTLLKLARAEASYLESLVHQLRSDPEQLRAVIESAAHNRPELVPDANGEAPRLEYLLDKPHFLAQLFRYTIHNTLVGLGQWTLVARYLDDLLETEKKYGYSDAFAEQQLFMDGARDVVEQAIEFTANIIIRAIVKHKRFEGFWVRIETYDDAYTGALLEVKSSPASSAMLESSDLFGSLYRFALAGHTDRDATEELLRRFSDKDSHDQLKELDDHLTGHITRLQSFFNFYKLLGFGDKSSLYHADERLRELRKNSEEARKVLNAAAIERHIKGLPSLARETTFRKIWSEVDNLTQKRFKTSLEKLLGYGDLPPPRNLIPRRKPRSRPAPVLPRRVRPQPQEDDLPRHQPEPVVEHEPVKLTPVSYLSDVRQTVHSEDSPARIGPKVKTVGVPRPPAEDADTDDACTMVEQKEGDESRVQFIIRKRSVYETFERVFKGGKGVVEQSDFIKALCHIGSSKDESSEGCRILLSLPPNNQPLIIHKIHGRAPEMSSGYLSSYRRQLETLVNWSMDTFILSSER